MSPDVMLQLIGIVKWPAAVVILVVIFLVIFKKPISGFISRSKRFKAAGFEATASSPETVAEVDIKKEEQVPGPPPEQEKKKELSGTEEPRTLEDWQTEMFIASLARNRERVDTAFVQIRSLNKDDLSLKKDEIFYRSILFKFGDTSATTRLQKLAGDEEVAYQAYMALGSCFFQTEDFHRSSEYYLHALGKANSDDERSSALVQYSSSLYRDGKKVQAVSAITQELSTTNLVGSKVRLYEALAEIFEKENDLENRAFVLDKAIELQPNYTGLLFKAAYAYSKCNHDDLSLFHYKNAKKIDSDEPGVLNNLGVQYDNLKMPIKSVESYRKAERLGETLASANLAYRLLNTGFKKEAEEVLNSASKQDDVHQNVNSALSEIPKRVEGEDKIEEQHIKSALWIRKFLLAYTGARFARGDALTAVAGRWKSDGGIEYEFEVAGNTVTATWKKRLFSSSEYDWKFEGSLFNNSATLTFYKKEYDLSTREQEYKKKGAGLLYCSQDGNTIGYLEKDESGRIEVIQTLQKSTAS